jgi:hypothetical protein
MPRKKTTSSQTKKTEVNSGIPVFNLRKLKAQAKRQKRRRKTTLREQRSKFLLAEQVGLLGIYDVDRLLNLLHPGKFKKKWRLPFTLDRKDLYTLYRSNYQGKTPFTKTTVDKNYSDWVRYNYALAAKLALEQGAYSCLLRSPFFWKALYIQNLIDQDSRKTFDEKRYDKLLHDDASLVYKMNDCVVKDLYRVQDTTCLPMPKWVALRMYFRPKFRNQVEKSEHKWATEGLSAKDLIKAEPLFIDMWKKKFEEGLSSLQFAFAQLKTGNIFYTL